MYKHVSNAFFGSQDRLRTQRDKGDRKLLSWDVQILQRPGLRLRGDRAVETLEQHFQVHF